MNQEVKDSIILLASGGTALGVYLANVQTVLSFLTVVGAFVLMAYKVYRLFKPKKKKGE